MTDSLVLSPGLSPELAAIASRVEAAMRADPLYRDMIHRWLADAGVAAAHDPVDDARLFAFLMTEEPQTDPEVLMSAFGELAGVVALAGLGIAGIFDPTPTSDGAATIVALGMTRYSGWYFVDAALSAVSMVPYLGDAVGKPVLLAKCAARTTAIVAKLEAMAVTAGTHVAAAIAALRRGERIAPLPLGSFSPMAKLGSVGARDVDEVLNTVDGAKRRIERLAAYMKRRGIEVLHGDEGANLLASLGKGGTLGGFGTIKGKPILVFPGVPDRVVIHHEMWHLLDFLHNYRGDVAKWERADKFRKEAYVHERLTGDDFSGKRSAVTKARAVRRWASYTLDEQMAQLGSFRSSALRGY